MRKLNSPAGSAQRTFRNIGDAKHKSQRSALKSLRRRVYKAYRDYPVYLNSISPITLSTQQAQALRSCYNSRTKTLTDLRQDILNLAGSSCPYCGVDRPTTVDHFAPKEDYPEFSVFPLNLVGCCDLCNIAKGTDFLANGRRLFLHGYLDQLPANTNCLRTKIHWQNGHPKFTFFLAFTPAIQLSLFVTLAEHVHRLGLLESYSKVAHEEFNDQSDWIVNTDTRATLRLRILRNIAKKRVLDGPLSWRVALWEAVHGDNATIDYLRNL